MIQPLRKWLGCRPLLGWAVALWALSAAGASPVWVLAPGFEVEPLENFQLQWQSLEPWGVDRVLVGRVGNEVGYFIAARRASEQRERQQWAALEKQLRRSGEGALTVVFRGRTAVDGGAVSYRAYRYRRAGEPVEQLYHRVAMDGGTYWLYATAVAPLSLDGLLPVTEALVRRAHKKAGH